jgi:hypothetical protein
MGTNGTPLGWIRPPRPNGRRDRPPAREIHQKTCGGRSSGAGRKARRGAPRCARLLRHGVESPEIRQGVRNDRGEPAPACRPPQLPSERRAPWGESRQARRRACPSYWRLSALWRASPAPRVKRLAPSITTPITTPITAQETTQEKYQLASREDSPERRDPCLPTDQNETQQEGRQGCRRSQRSVFCRAAPKRVPSPARRGGTCSLRAA